MADLTTNSYNNRYSYSNNRITYGDNSSADTVNRQQQTAYGDGNSAIPTSYDDKRLDPAKDKAKKDIQSNPVVSTLKTLIGEPVNIAIGTVPFLAIDKLLKWLPAGKTFEKSTLGKITGHLDNLVDKLPKFDWLKKAYADLPDTNFIKQIINAKPVKPVWSLAKSQITPNRTSILTKMLDEAVEITGKNPEAVKKIKETLEAASKGPGYDKLCEEAFNTAKELAGTNKSDVFKALSNRAQFFTGKHSGISKLLMSVYNNMTTFLTADFRGFKSGLSLKSLGGNGMKIAGLIFMVGMGANILGEIIKDTWNAPKGEKISTFAHGLIAKLGSWVLMVPLGSFMYKAIGSLKNLQGGNLISKVIKAPFRWAGKLFNVGLGMPEAKTLPGKLLNGIKGVFGGIERLALYMFALTPLSTAGLGAVSHSMFGKPTTLLAKEKAEAEKDNEPAKTDTDELSKALAANKGMLTVAAKTQTNMQNNTNAGINPMIAERLKLRALAADSKPDSSQLPENNNEQEITAKNSDNNGQSEYIPSDTRKDPSKNIDAETKLNAALAESDRKIKAAQDTLNSL